MVCAGLKKFGDFARSIIPARKNGFWRYPAEKFYRAGRI
jgi:hypothetical protein